MKLGLEDKVVFITGSARGIGKTIAEGFAKEGSIVVLNDVLEDVLKASVEEFRQNGYKAYGYAFDITNQDATNEAIDKIEAEVGPIHVLINNAGMTRRVPFEEMSLKDWNTVISVDLTGSFIVGQAIAKKMIPRGDGRIVNITSINAELVRETISPYCAAKGALKNLTKSMATELGKYGIRTNAVGPGYIMTDLTAPLAADPVFDNWIKSEVPLKRWGKTEEITNTVIFLASDAASYINGQSIYVEGGWQACL